MLLQVFEPRQRLFPLKDGGGYLEKYRCDDKVGGALGAVMCLDGDFAEEVLDRCDDVILNPECVMVHELGLNQLAVVTAAA